MDEAVQKAAAQIANARNGVPQIKAFFDEPTFTASYLVHDPETRTAAIIDSVLGIGKDLVRFGRCDHRLCSRA